MNNQTAEPSKSKSSTNQQQITLNSYTKKSTISTVSSISMSSDIPSTISHSSNHSFTDSGVNSMKNTTTGTNGNNVKSHTGSFNISPKLDEVPIIEPLICKRVAKERLTDIRFKEDGFLAATQDGYVYTWARPVKT